MAIESTTCEYLKGIEFYTCSFGEECAHKYPENGINFCKIGGILNGDRNSKPLRVEERNGRSGKLTDRLRTQE